MYENTRTYWTVELAKLRRSQRRTGPTVRLFNNLSDRDRVDFYNCTERIASAANRGDRTTLQNMRRAVTAQPSSPLRTLVLANLDSTLGRLPSQPSTPSRLSSLSSVQARHDQPRRRRYLEVRTPTAGVTAVR